MTTKFIATELRTLLVQSKFFSSISQVSYYGSSSTNGLFSQAKLRTASEKAEADRTQDVVDSAEIPSASKPSLTGALELLKESIIPMVDAHKFPLIHKLGINVDDEQVLDTLLSELVLYKRKNNNNQTDVVQGVALPKDALLVKHEFDNPAKHRLYLPIPSGYTKHTSLALAKNKTSSLEWCVRNASSEIKGEAGKKMISSLESKMTDDFEDVASMSGYVGEMTNVMSPEFCAAMYEDAEVGRKNQRELNKYLTYHFGKRVTAHEYEVEEIKKDYIKFHTETIDVMHKGKMESVLYSWKDLAVMIHHHRNEIFDNNSEDIEKIDICLGGDHGKGKFTFVALVTVRYKSNIKDKKLELQIGQIDHGGDTVELLQPLLE